MFDRKKKGVILRKLKGGDVNKVFLQVPEGLKTGALELIDFLEKNKIDVMLSVEPCFGACDLRDREAKMLGCDVLLHVGHSDFGLKTKIPVMYEEYEIPCDPVPLLEWHLKKLDYDRISLGTTIQFVHCLERVKKFLERKGKRVYMGLPARSKREGQVLGCDYSSAKPLEDKVDCFLFIGSGRFHPLGLQERVDKPVLFLDIEKNNLTNFFREKTRMETLRTMRIQKAGDLRNFGIVISTKPGQINLKTAESVREKLKSKGKNAYILVADQLTPEKLIGLKIDVLVNTACPRMREDFEQFRKVILDPEDVDSL
ncbi:MAG: diphthamide biosynthesis enzyme Dph2 [Candidatus Aenigmatarchaeota archaeon]|nr:MAG: diphthamide biosynthesis enzyme Dph2 [Candidatus Aenigmarchaeota archaeon]